jgi:hypothetical protein
MVASSSRVNDPREWYTPSARRVNSILPIFPVTSRQATGCSPPVPHTWV